MNKLILGSIFLLCFVFQNSFSQNVNISKTLPQPKFYLIGVDDPMFPIYGGNYDDTIQMAAYGLTMQIWLNRNMDYYESKLSNPTGAETFTYLDFANLDNDGRAIFKIIASQYAPALREQKKVLIKKFNSENPIVKGSPAKTFPNDAIQVYLMNKKEIEWLKFKLKK